MPPRPLVQHGDEMEHRDGKVLFAYDGSDQAKASIRAAARQLRTDRDAIVVTVWEPLAALPFGGGAFASADVDTTVEAEACRTAEEGARLARSAGFDATPLAMSGSPVWHVIVGAAEEHDAALVVMGSHGRTGISLVLMGSVAAAVARHVDRPVLIVHPPADRKAA
jgi:nucleotide-binding universal stress UspA family protein